MATFWLPTVPDRAMFGNRTVAGKPEPRRDVDRGPRGDHRSSARGRLGVHGRSGRALGMVRGGRLARTGARRCGAVPIRGRRRAPRPGEARRAGGSTWARGSAAGSANRRSSRSICDGSPAGPACASPSEPPRHSLKRADDRTRPRRRLPGAGRPDPPDLAPCVVFIRSFHAGRALLRRPHVAAGRLEAPRLVAGRRARGGTRRGPGQALRAHPRSARRRAGVDGRRRRGMGRPARSIEGPGRGAAALAFEEDRVGHRCGVFEGRQ